jgi:hypothetical protein
MFQVRTADPPTRATRTLLSTSPGGGTGVPVQVPPWQASPVVQASPSLHAVPLGAGGLAHAPVAGLHVPATWL